MKTRQTITIFLTGLSLLITQTMYSQEMFGGSERKPFNSETPDRKQFLNSGPAKAPGVPALPTPSEEDKVGGAPVGDATWIFTVMAGAYLIIAGKNKKLRMKN